MHLQLFSSFHGAKSPAYVTIMFLWYLGWKHREQVFPIAVIVKATIEKDEKRQKKNNPLNSSSLCLTALKTGGTLGPELCVFWVSTVQSGFTGVLPPWGRTEYRFLNEYIAWLTDWLVLRQACLSLTSFLIIAHARGVWLYPGCCCPTNSGSHLYHRGNVSEAARPSLVASHLEDWNRQT